MSGVRPKSFPANLFRSGAWSNPLKACLRAPGAGFHRGPGARCGPVHSASTFASAALYRAAASSYPREPGPCPLLPSRPGSGLLQTTHAPSSRLFRATQGRCRCFDPSRNCTSADAGRWLSARRQHYVCPHAFCLCTRLYVLGEGVKHGREKLGRAELRLQLSLQLISCHFDAFEGFQVREGGRRWLQGRWRGGHSRTGRRCMSRRRGQARARSNASAGMRVWRYSSANRKTGRLLLRPPSTRRLPLRKTGSKAKG